MAQLLFIPISQLPITEMNNLSQTKHGSKGFGSTDHTAMISNAIQLKTIAGQPPGTSFLGAQPSKVTVMLNSLNGPITQIIINSGSNISLISTKLLERFNPPLKLKDRISRLTRSPDDCPQINMYH